MKKKVAITFVIGMFVVVLLGIAVSANYTKTHPRQEAYADNWYQNPDAEPIKMITSQESAQLNKEQVLSKKESNAISDVSEVVNKEKTTEKLTYSVTNKMEKENPLDVYCDSNMNEYRYNQDGELDTYRQSLSDKKDLPYGEDPCTKDECVTLAWAYLQKLYGERINGFSFKSIKPSGENYYVRFAKKYGENDFIVGATALAVIQPNGDLGGATISRDLMEDFNSTRVEKLTEQIVKDETLSSFEESQKGCVPGTAELSAVSLMRTETDFKLHLSFRYEIGNGAEQLGEYYYEID